MAEMQLGSGDTGHGRFKIAVIGGSAGSLEVLLTMLTGLQMLAFPLLVVLHRKGSDSVLAELLTARTGRVVKEAEEKEMLIPGQVYLAPGDYHLLIERDGSLALDASEKINFSRPSIDVTMESAVDVYGASVLGVLLSGGNSDGVRGLKAIEQAGGYCLVQHPASAAVPALPQAAFAEISSCRLMNPDELSDFINKL